MENVKVLKLDSAFQPLEVIGWQEAFVLTWLKKAYAIEFTSKWVHSAKKSFQVPSVIALFTYIDKNFFSIQPTRKNLLIRDDYSCQYCGVRQTKKALLTIDHIIPRSKGGKTTWNNCVAACMRCNQQKGACNLEQTGLKLLKKPKKLAYKKLVRQKLGPSNKNWLRYL